MTGLSKLLGPSNTGWGLLKNQTNAMVELNLLVQVVDTTLQCLYAAVVLTHNYFLIMRAITNLAPGLQNFNGFKL